MHIAGKDWRRNWRRNLLFLCYRGYFCGLVYIWIYYQVHCCTVQGKYNRFIKQNTAFFLFQIVFIMSFLNIIDLLGILPFYASVFLNFFPSQYSIVYIAKAAQILRILRILRIFKLSRHITGLKTLATTLRNSHRWILFKVWKKI